MAGGGIINDEGRGEFLTVYLVEELKLILKGGPGSRCSVEKIRLWGMRGPLYI